MKTGTGILRSKKTIIGFLIILLIIITIIIGYILHNSPTKRIVRQLELGNRFLSEQDFEQAIVAFNDIISIDPMCVSAYIGMADAYLGTMNYEKAKEILQQGINTLSSEGDSYLSDLSLLESKLGIVQNEIDKQLVKRNIAQDSPEFTEREENLPYINLPFGPNDFKMVGYSVLDGYHKDKIDSLLQDQLHNIDDVNHIFSKGEHYFDNYNNEMSIIGVEFESQGATYALFSDDGLYFYHPRPFDYDLVGWGKDTFAYPSPYVDIPEFFQRDIITCSEFTIFDEIINNAKKNGSSYEFESQYGINKCRYNFIDENIGWCWLDYEINNMRYTIEIGFASDSDWLNCVQIKPQY